MCAGRCIVFIGVTGCIIVVVVDGFGRDVLARVLRVGVSAVVGVLACMLRVGVSAVVGVLGRVLRVALARAFGRLLVVGDLIVCMLRVALAFGRLLVVGDLSVCMLRVVVLTRVL